MKEFYSAVDTYAKLLSSFGKKRIYIIGNIENESAFFSAAPFSSAAHALGCDIFMVLKKQTVEAYKNLFKIWRIYYAFFNEETIPSEDHKDYSKYIALAEFIKEVEKKAEGEFEPIFEPPDLFLFAKKEEFCMLDREEVFSELFFEELLMQDDIEKLRFPKHERIPYNTGWFKKPAHLTLRNTCSKIWKHVYALKPHERVGMGFELIPDLKKITLPLQDYLDSYAIINAMKSTCPSDHISLSSYSSRPSQLDVPEKTVELSATILGCELDKNIEEPSFQKYLALTKALKFSKITINDATFSIHGKGYSGRHIFGEKIGYPTLNRKTRWSTPGGIIYKFPWLPQTKHEERPPSCRIAFTETLPVEVFIQSCKIDWDDTRRKNDKIIKRMNRSEYIKVESEKTDLTVHLINQRTGKRRWPKPSDADVRSKVNKSFYEHEGIKAGNMANIPCGEAFVTPEYIDGTFYGDVVIAIDQSYNLTSEEPLAIKCDKQGYKILSGPKNIIDKIHQKKKDAKKLLKMRAKTGSLPKYIFETSKKNFESIGEFAINTNPSAQLCDYLIVNEKIAGMIHIALGSGFDEDKHTEYHYDIVINAKKQKLDIFGVSGNKKIWILKKGVFVE